MKHPHFEMIMEWAADTSRVVQWNDSTDGWHDCASSGPSWDPNREYRFKPEPKPDVVCTGLFGLYENDYLCYHVSSSGKPNVKFTFDGGTRELKSLEVLK